MLVPFANAHAVDAPPGAAVLELQRAESIEEYERIQQEIAVSGERRAKLESELESVKKDNATISAALIQTVKTERKLAQDIEDIAARLSDLRHREGTVKASLSERRDVLAEVLAALQRMGLNPPPAILVRPEDALSSVRSAILLGAVVPDLRAETEALIVDLDELHRLVATIDTEREKLFTTVAEQATEKERLTLLQEEKRKLQSRSEMMLVSEQKRAEDLAGRAGSLEELIASLESDIESVREANEKAQAAERDRLAREAAEAATPTEPNLTAALPFSALKSQIALPVSGRLDRRFGAADGTGGRMMGDTVRTHSGAIVTAPAEGSVLYAGPFRSYGQLLILNAGEGYHVVLAGMGKINVALGQTVLAGEPVGAMGEARLASAAAFDTENSAPELYVEFRRDGKPVDPSPWWAERSSGRTGNDS